MGMFDYVWAACPSCSSRVEFQSKSGPCQLNYYYLESAPEAVAEGVVGDDGYCEKCKAVMTVHAAPRRAVDFYVRLKDG